jgi:hypothetical protein
VIGDGTDVAGAAKTTVSCALPAETFEMLGAKGTSEGVADADVPYAPEPTTFCATTLNV